MRTLNDCFISGGQMSDIGSAGNLSEPAPMPDAGSVISAVIHVHTLIDATTTFDVMKNGSDTGFDCTLPDATPDESGYEMMIPGEVHVEIGDAMTLQANGEQSAGIAEVTWVLRR